MYLALLFKWNSVKKATVVIFCSSLTIEFVQLISTNFGWLYGRAFNVDDLILNTLGGVIELRKF
ncbi:VanZ family protein [Bacillus horti]|uniref:VanZ family protein n=1 Tax=Caldalkalibacillus horti TaxID=77523 RepID=UPI0027D81632|nr:VanZ family protein [Bacillus horti]